MPLSAATAPASRVRCSPLAPETPFDDARPRLTCCSALLRAIHEKLIPGIPEGTRIAILQQSRLIDEDGAEKAGREPTVLGLVVDRATSRDVVEQEIQSWSPLQCHASVCGANPHQRFRRASTQRMHSAP